MWAGIPYSFIRSLYPHTHHPVSPSLISHSLSPHWIGHQMQWTTTTLMLQETQHKILLSRTCTEQKWMFLWMGISGEANTWPDIRVRSIFMSVHKRVIADIPVKKGLCTQRLQLKFVTFPQMHNMDLILLYIKLITGLVLKVIRHTMIFIDRCRSWRHIHDDARTRPIKSNHILFVCHFSYMRATQSDP